MPGNRRSRRWRGFWYGAARAYYVTVVVHQRRCLLGTVRDGLVAPSAAGSSVMELWQRLDSTFQHVRLDAFVVMPNHLHGILCIIAPQHGGSFGATLGELVGWFKTMSTRRYVRGVKEDGWPRFEQRLWQRNYFDRVIRDEDELNHARGYTWRNPMRWSLDPLNPERRDAT